MSEGVNLEAVSASLKAVKVLRTSVRDLFKLLSEGEISHQNQNKNESKEQLFLDEVKSLIENISSKTRELESSCTLLAHPSVPLSINLGNTGLLGQDPAFERTNLYSSLIASYRWNDKLHEYASHTYTILTANSLKRTHLGSFNSLLNMALRSRMPFLLRPNIIGHNLAIQQLDNILHSIQRLFPDMTVEITRPFGAPVVLKITLERVMKAVILLRGLTSEWVLVKGLNEDFKNEDCKIDIWTESRYQVFRKITENANAAMLHFFSPAHPDIALKSFVTWLHSYNSLFSKPCRKCEYRLQNSMPPTWRDYRHMEEYHELCKP